MTDDDANGIDRFRHDVAAHLLGALDDQERAAFVAHLAECSACSDEVAELAPTAAALDRLTPQDWADVDEPEQVPPAILSQLTRAVVRRRTRMRAALVACATAAAAAVIALLVMLLPASGDGSSGTPGRTMSAVGSTPISATAQLASAEWGTRITVTCGYRTTSPYPDSPATYALEVVDTGGTRYLIGSWSQHGSEVRFTSGIGIAEQQIASVNIALPDGTPVLTLRLH